MLILGERRPQSPRQLGSSGTKIRFPRGSRVGPSTLTGQMTPSQAGNRIPDVHSREGRELPALVMRGLLQFKEPMALNPVPLQGNPGHLRDSNPTSFFSASVPTPPTPRACCPPEAHALTCPWPVPLPGLSYVKYYLLLSSLRAPAPSRSCPRCPSQYVSLIL